MPVFYTPVTGQNPCSEHADLHIPLALALLFTGDAFSFAVPTRFAAAAQPSLSGGGLVRHAGSGVVHELHD
jgi:hypothetical protein